MNEASKAVSLERRAKRYVKAPTHRWFAVCSPGTESVLRGELAALNIEPSPSNIRGGVEFRGRLEDGLRANLHLRTAARILLRIATFRARAVEDVFRETVALPWEAFIPQGCRLTITCTIHGSRINSRTLLESTLRDAVCRRFSDQALAIPFPAEATGQPEYPIIIPADATATAGNQAPGLPQTIQARLQSDYIELSLDSSGELLHRRGWRRESVAAPIRENLAATVLLAAGYAPGMNLIDGMCGSGTFAIEAAHIASGTPPGISTNPPRAFAFMDWPAFSRPAWEHLCRSTQASTSTSTIIDRDTIPSHVRDPSSANTSTIIARDIDPAVLKVAGLNAQTADVANLITFDNIDFFKATPPCPPGLLVLNPPYGMRLDTTRDISAFYRRIATRISSHWIGWRYAIILPDQSLARSWPIHRDSSLNFMHGGLKAIAIVGTAERM